MITRLRRFVKGGKTFFSVFSKSFSKKVRGLRTRDTIIGEKTAGYAANIPVAFDNGAGFCYTEKEDKGGTKMKRTTVFLLALLLAAGCLFALAGCRKRCTAADLSAHLDEEGFFAGMTQLGLQEIAKRYTGTDHVAGAYYDGESVVGWRASGENYSFENGCRASEDEKTATRKNSFSTSKITFRADPALRDPVFRHDRKSFETALD